MPRCVGCGGLRLFWLGLLVISVMGILAASVIAQPIAPTGIDASVIDAQGNLPTLGELFATSKVINGVILGLSAIAVTFFVYLMLTIKTGSMAPTSFVDDVTKLVIDGQYDQAADLCRNYRGVFIASIIQRCVENAAKPHSVIMDMLDAEGRRRADIVWNRVSYLADVSNVAPMLGLLGTVMGMIKAFFLLPTQSASISSKILSHGIGEAMATTMFGLVVAIISLLFYSMIKSRATRALAEVEQVAHSVADHIKRGES